MSALPHEVRQARSFLRQKLKAGSADVSPRLFANAASELNMPFADVATVLARMYSGGQSQAFYREQALESATARGDK